MGDDKRVLGCVPILKMVITDVPNQAARLLPLSAQRIAYMDRIAEVNFCLEVADVATALCALTL